MNKNLFCFQCEQTSGCTGCTGNAGVCGKKNDIALLQDKLTGALIGLARCTDAQNVKLSDRAARVMIEGLFATLTNVNFDEKALTLLYNAVQEEKKKLAASCTDCADPCGRKDDYDMACLWTAQEDIRSLKSLILFGLRGVAAYAYHAMVLGFTDDEIINGICKGLFYVGEDLTMEQLLPEVLEVGKINLTCMELLDRANTTTYGTPVPTAVSMKVEKGPFIVVTGHDLRDLKMLLEQTEGKNINIYTHGEMLPCHAYPELKKYPHLKGNFGTGWQNQQSEFHNIPAPILFTTNCIMPVRQSYCDRVFTTSVVSYPELVHIGDDKDFTPVIEKALECGGYDEDREMTGMNGGKSVVTGFARNAVLANADEIIDRVKRGKIRHFFLIL